MIISSPPLVTSTLSVLALISVGMHNAQAARGQPKVRFSRCDPYTRDVRWPPIRDNSGRKNATSLYGSAQNKTHGLAVIDYKLSLRKVAESSRQAQYQYLVKKFVRADCLAR